MRFALLPLILALAACGGGGGSSPTTPAADPLSTLFLDNIHFNALGQQAITDVWATLLN